MHVSASIIVSATIFFATFALIVSERVHRTVIAIGAAVLVVLLGNVMGFYTPEQAFESIDFSTLGLLVGMMVIVTILEETGFLEYIAIVAAKKAKGDPWLLLVALATVTTVVSCILDNVTTVIIIVPVTILIAKITKIDALPLLMAEALLSDTGGVATLVGDPPNVMIGSAAHFSFNDFLIHAAPVVFIAWIATLFSLKIVFRKQLAKKPENIDELMKWDASKSLKDIPTIKKTLAVLVLVVFLFFFQKPLGIEPSLAAIIGAAVLLLLVSINRDPQGILAKLEWSVLGFFVALFVLVGALEHAGAINIITEGIMSSSGDNIVMLAVVVLWVSAFASALIDNIPFTMAMIPVLSNITAHDSSMNILWWALALGVGFGGNGTPIGSTANVVVVTKSEETDDPITFKKWFKSGSVATIITCLVATAVLVLFHSFFES